VGDATSALQKEIVCSLNNKMHVAGIPCNLAKAFHRVSKRLCSWDLCFYGIQGTAGQWFKSYIHERNKKSRKNSPHSNYWKGSQWRSQNIDSLGV